MEFRETIKKLSAYAQQDTYAEPQICDLLGKFLNCRALDYGAAHHALSAMLSGVTVPRAMTGGTGMLTDPASYVENPNLVLILNKLLEATYLPSHYPICHSLPWEKRRYFYPFVLIGCFKVDKAFGPHAYKVPEGDINRLRSCVRKFLAPTSFSPPVIFNNLYPVSAFTRSSALSQKINYSVQYVADSLYKGDIPPRSAPDFEALYCDDAEEYLEGLERDYRAIYGVACLESSPTLDSLKVARHVATVCGQVPVEVVNLALGDLMPELSTSEETRRVKLSRITANRPFPALDGYNEFLENILIEDRPAEDFWDIYRKG
jgi:hypothetical protein